MPIYRCTVDLDFGAGTGRGTNSWTVRTVDVGLGEIENIQDLMGQVQTFYTALAGKFPANTTMSWDGSAQQLGVAEPAYQESAAGWSVAGGAAANTYGPAPAMVCVTWRTSVATRSGRGRTFLGPIAMNVIGPDGSVDAADLSDIRTAANNLATQNGSLEAGALVIWSETQQVGRDILGSSVTDQIAVLRSRRG